MHQIAHIHTDFPTKFGIPRQAGMVEGLQGKIVFTPDYRNPDALRGIEGFSHLWLIWEFSASNHWSPTVRPPRLGGNVRMGVFATRAPFRPNPIGLSCVRLLRVDWETAQGPVLHVSGADMMDGTPIFDIKPYLPYADVHPEAVGGFTDPLAEAPLQVQIPPQVLAQVPQAQRQTLLQVLACDPRPRYQDDPERVYGMAFGGMDVRFRVEGKTLIVEEIQHD